MLPEYGSQQIYAPYPHRERLEIGYQRVPRKRTANNDGETPGSSYPRAKTPPWFSKNPTRTDEESSRPRKIQLIDITPSSNSRSNTPAAEPPQDATDDAPTNAGAYGLAYDRPHWSHPPGHEETRAWFKEPLYPPPSPRTDRHDTERASYHSTASTTVQKPPQDHLARRHRPPDDPSDHERPHSSISGAEAGWGARHHSANSIHTSLPLPTAQETPIRLPPIQLTAQDHLPPHTSFIPQEKEWRPPASDGVLDTTGRADIAGRLVNPERSHLAWAGHRTPMGRTAYTRGGDSNMLPSPQIEHLSSDEAQREQSWSESGTWRSHEFGLDDRNSHGRAIDGDHDIRRIQNVRSVENALVKDPAPLHTTQNNSSIGFRGHTCDASRERPASFGEQELSRAAQDPYDWDGPSGPRNDRGRRVQERGLERHEPDMLSARPVSDSLSRLHVRGVASGGSIGAHELGISNRVRAEISPFPHVPIENGSGVSARARDELAGTHEAHGFRGSRRQSKRELQEAKCERDHWEKRARELERELDGVRAQLAVLTERSERRTRKYEHELDTLRVDCRNKISAVETELDARERAKAQRVSVEVQTHVAHEDRGVQASEVAERAPPRILFKLRKAQGTEYQSGLGDGTGLQDTRDTNKQRVDDTGISGQSRKQDRRSCTQLAPKIGGRENRLREQIAAVEAEVACLKAESRQFSKANRTVRDTPATPMGHSNPPLLADAAVQAVGGDISSGISIDATSPIDCPEPVGETPITSKQEQVVQCSPADDTTRPITSPPLIKGTNLQGKKMYIGVPAASWGVSELSTKVEFSLKSKQPVYIGDRPSRDSEKQKR
ncbi:uncharacterized protein FIBRA_01968 [Fibroporia radiculosa]|uniref:Uncharacterized protein n=1 Tax=Fibroporia radiculosa TaxID=599839 RepID=J4G1A1_9APHY|nr:uncharacterized protein FIBRA_01968 [Fibroporia radiculosa]CCL99943.1 predicted protein [Fibroporia radiculosa]